jgi:hypothetical protein
MYRTILIFLAFSGCAGAGVIGWSIESGSVVRGPINPIDLALDDSEFISVLLRGRHCLQGIESRGADPGGFRSSSSGGFAALPRSVSAGLRSISTLDGSSSRFRGSIGLLLTDAQASPQIHRLQANRDELQKPDDSQRPSKSDEPPIGRRFILLAIATIVGVGCMLVAATRSNSHRVAAGFLAGFSLALFAAFSLLFFLSGFRWSWGWWL